MLGFDTMDTKKYRMPQLLNYSVNLHGRDKNSDFSEYTRHLKDLIWSIISITHLILCRYQKSSVELLESALNMMENQGLCFSVQITSRWKN